MCYCHTISNVSNEWPVVVLQHPLESKHAIGTARIAELSLTHCELVEGSRFNRQDIQSRTGIAAEPLLIYPGENAEDISAFAHSPPRPLIFIDASWRKSYRMLQESTDLHLLPKASIQPLRKSRYRIRKASRPDSLSTLEAIVEALSVLENTTSKYQPLLKSMDWMIEKQLTFMSGKDNMR